MNPKISQKSSFAPTMFYKERMGGLLLHITSLPGKYGIGDIGYEFYKIINFLNKYGMKILQILPLGPTGYGNSPYSSISAFAGNSLLISPDLLREENLLSSKECVPPRFPATSVDFEAVIPFKNELLKTANEKFKEQSGTLLKKRYVKFLTDESFWLDDFALYMSIKDAYNQKEWSKWDIALKKRNSNALKDWERTHKGEIDFYKFSQFIFVEQWAKAKKYANEKNIWIIGDIPLYCAYDSVDVWANSELFHLNEEKELKFVAGVPPDYFSATGQRWGNPIYNWEKIKEQKFGWWVKRIKHLFRFIDALRIDHFRGLESYWQIPAAEPTAIVGTWRSGPGKEFFKALENELGTLAIIAEDLGIVTPEVDNLREITGFPGMRVLQFAFADQGEGGYCKNPYLPHNYEKNTVVYTGTHDNAPTRTWFKNASDDVKNHIYEYINPRIDDICGEMMKLAWASVAHHAIVPLQDLLRLGVESRMNLPGTGERNWEWRFTWDQLTDAHGKEIQRLNRLYCR
ncbi:MAG: 4-alpha-glucanotransferase [Candidatus Heimdallarchaeota archaeon]|nr:4-alpha-glucanotransferase [Candidatus Heimdallarchaeota archaeon]